jgi:YfiH family protein
MMRFTPIEVLGCTAAMSGTDEGDCASRAPSSGTAQFLEQLGLGGRRPVLVRQTHSDIIHVAESIGLGDAPVGDALITARPGLPIGVAVADCVPVFLFAPDSRTGGIVHAGREGTRQQIAGKTVLRLQEVFGTAPESVHALIGPSAGPCCYEVSVEMAQACAAEGIPVRGRYLDLWEANFRQLCAAGVPAQHVTVSKHCTLCGVGFHSYRASGTAARNLALFCLP